MVAAELPERSRRGHVDEEDMMETLDTTVLTLAERRELAPLMVAFEAEKAGAALASAQLEQTKKSLHACLDRLGAPEQVRIEIGGLVLTRQSRSSTQINRKLLATRYPDAAEDVSYSSSYLTLQIERKDEGA